MRKMLRQTYGFMREAARAQARWEFEASMNILSSRKRMIIILAVTMPLLLFTGYVLAGGQDMPSILGGKHAYSPAYYTPSIFGVSIAIGLCAGLITGCIGAGGGFIIAPALMSAGIKGILAVGTDLFHIFAKAIMGTVAHKKLGNVSVSLAIAFLVGSIGGVLGGGIINRAIYEFDPMLSDSFISFVYVILLGFLGMYAMTDFIRSYRRGDHGDAHGHGGKGEANTKKSLPAILQGSRIPPMITFDEDLTPGGKKIPAVYVALCGAFVGFVAAIMGVGGGFLTFPMFVYVLGVSSFTTVGTDILQIIFTAGFASITQYAIYGFIFYTLAMGMLLGSLVGIQIGALATKMVKGIYIRGFYAIAIMAGFVNRLFALPSKLVDMEYISMSKSTAAAITQVGNVTFFIVVGLFAIWVFSVFFRNISKLRAEA